MVIILKKGVDATQVENLKALLTSHHITPRVTAGTLKTIIGCVGDITHIDPGLIEALDGVESVQRIQEPYKAANRKFHPEDSVVDCSGVKVGGGHFAVIAGPCSVEGEDQLVGIAKAVKAAGATMLRGGAFKPRTSPYAFQGMGAEGLRLLSLAKKETGLPVVTELMDFKDINIYRSFYLFLTIFNICRTPFHFIIPRFPFAITESSKNHFYILKIYMFQIFCWE